MAYNKKRYNRKSDNGYYDKGYSSDRPASRGQHKKKSGCKKGYKLGDKSRPYYSGWNKSKEGFLTLFANPTKDTIDVPKKGGSGMYQKWIVEYKLGRFGKKQLATGFLDLQDLKLRIPDLGIVMNPKTDYCGTMNAK